MKFYFFTKGNKDVPSSRYRAYYLAEALELLGYETIVVPTTEYSIKFFFAYLRILLSIKSDDVLYLQRTIYNKYFTVALLIARLCGRHYIFDIDDAVYEHSRLKTELFVRFADFVTCGSEKIRDWTIKRNKQSYVLINGIPLSIYTRRITEPIGIPTIGWIGTYPEVYIKPVISALQILVEQGHNFNIKIIGAMGNPEVKNLLENVPNVTVVDSLNWSDPTEAVREIKQFTVGIMPLTSSIWDQVKYFKALEYMACSVPVVASSGVTVRAILEEFGCGFIATDTSEWVEKLSLLLNNQCLRSDMGAKGRVAIEKKYSSDAVTRELLSLIKDTKLV